MSPLRSSAGPAVMTNGTSSSAAMICASDVLPRPGGPASRTWSSASPRALAASMRDRELLLERLLADEVLAGAAGAASGRASSSVARGRWGVWMRARGASLIACRDAGAALSAWAMRSSGRSPGAPRAGRRPPAA